MNIYIKSMLLISVCLLNAFTFANDSRHLTITSPLPEEKPCVCETKLNLLTYLENALATTQDPLTEEEKKIIAEVDGHQHLEWWNLSEEEQKEKSVEEPLFKDRDVLLTLCFQMIHSENYLEDLPSPIITILEAANLRYSHKTGEEDNKVFLTEPMKVSAKQAYIGKIYMEKFLLKQKCDMGDFKELEPYNQIHNKPIFYADILNEKQGTQLISTLDSVPYNDSENNKKKISNYLENVNSIDELDEFKKLLFEIKENRPQGSSVRTLALRYIEEFGFEN